MKKKHAVAWLWVGAIALLAFVFLKKNGPPPNLFGQGRTPDASGRL